MAEFRIHHLVARLVALMDAPDRDAPERYVPLVQPRVPPYVPSQVTLVAAKRRVAAVAAAGADDFTRAYEAARVRASRIADPLLVVLARLADDEPLRGPCRRVPGSSARRRRDPVPCGG